MSGGEAIVYWGAAACLALTCFLTVLALIFKKTAAFTTARYVLLAAFLLITVFGIIRWVEWQHPPFVTLFESMITSIWFMLLMYLSLAIRTGRMAVLLLPVSLAALLMMGWSASLPSQASPLSETLSNTWLFIHASFATAGAAAFLIAASFSALFLAGPETMARMHTITAAIPEHSRLPGSILNFLLFGLVLWGVMIVSGSIWAHTAWGRYWAWDPIELWSLISWLLYAVVFHARLAFKLPARLFCWLTIVAALTVVFSLWGVGYLYETIHSYG
jgi:ABC-type transport system involved in cytochrome c biogenesis permease subunit